MIAARKQLTEAHGKNAQTARDKQTETHTLRCQQSTTCNQCHSQWRVLEDSYQIPSKFIPNRDQELLHNMFDVGYRTLSRHFKFANLKVC